MDFVAEIVMGYVDYCLSVSLKREQITEYKIIRYRDDYRIFASNPYVIEAVAKCLSEELYGVGMKLNPVKTHVSDNIVVDSVKRDKVYWQHVGKYEGPVQGYLLKVHELAEKFPNSGSLAKALDRLYDLLGEGDVKPGDPEVLISILVDIMYKNPRTYPVGCASISRLLPHFSRSKRLDIIKRISAKFDMKPNTGHLDLWLQRISLKVDESLRFDEPLCSLVVGEEADIWNMEWLKESVASTIDANSIIDRDRIEEMGHEVSGAEVKLFHSGSRDYYSGTPSG